MGGKGHLPGGCSRGKECKFSHERPEGQEEARCSAVVPTKCGLLGPESDNCELEPDETQARVELLASTLTSLYES